MSLYVGGEPIVFESKLITKQKEVDELRSALTIALLQRDGDKKEIEFLTKVRTSQAAMIGKVRGEWFDLLAEVAWLRRPLWVKIVGWFAR